MRQARATRATIQPRYRVRSVGHVLPSEEKHARRGYKLCDHSDEKCVHFVETNPRKARTLQPKNFQFPERQRWRTCTRVLGSIFPDIKSVKKKTKERG
jgi:hypothetical protein